ncbi:hypothetical protein D9V37_00280 [Nocardioides mangrovicus]|uniref:Uncharacterized protein n=1 Tax=Nocardioides mangrovicus TaxID=2478913 RepID=A0A3L8P528_9ACTN|nr:hypothetical protein D9V37_00280 [Nocardioides mangrovicus]
MLVTVLALAFAVGRLFVDHGDGTRAVSATTSPSPTVNLAPPVSTGTTSPTPSAAPGSTSSAGSASATPTPTALAAPTSVPTGACSDDEITVTPAVTSVTGGGDVALAMNLTTTTSSACTWKVSANAMVVAISKGQTRLWSTQDCSSAVPTQDVIVRPSDEQPTQVQLTWGGRRSTTGCASGQAWVDPGRYTITAASLGGEPERASFEVTAPARPTITKTAKPKQQKSPTGPTTTPPG